MKHDDAEIIQYDDASMSDLGKQFARRLADLPEATFQAALSKMSDEMISELTRADIPAARVEEAVEEFDGAAAAEWRRISAVILRTVRGRA